MPKTHPAADDPCVSKHVSTGGATLTVTASDSTTLHMYTDEHLADVSVAFERVLADLASAGVRHVHRRRRGPLDITTATGVAMRPTLRLGRGRVMVGTSTRSLQVRAHHGARRMDVYGDLGS